ncbi:MAG: class I SAM-dependent RNA methyltransferase [Hyphomicrobiaceae bacterium]
MTDGTRVTITSLGALGDGAAMDGGAPLFVPGGLPGETWEIGPGGANTLVVPHPDRQPDRCSHFGHCGGCMAHHMPPALYAEWKRDIVISELGQHGLPADVVAPLVTVPLASRRRAVLTAERRGGPFAIGFHAARSHRLEPMTDCAILVPAIHRALPLLARLAAVLLTAHDEGRFTVLATDTGLDVTLTEPIVELPAGARAVAADIAREGRFARISVGRTPVVTLGPPQLSFSGTVVVPPPGAFVQAVAEAERAMTSLVVEGVGRARRIADLFSGTGTFTLPLARSARVLAVDSDAEAMAALTAAFRGATGLKPVEARVRDLFREPLSVKELADLDAVVLDPPRAGAKAQAERLARTKVARVVMVSCNPATLARDLAILVAGGYRLVAVTPVDQFVLSAHVEAVAVLDRPR